MSARSCRLTSAEVERALTAVGTGAADSILTSARDAQSTLVSASTEAASQIKSLSADVERTLSAAGRATASSIVAGAREAQTTLVTASADAASQVKSLAADVERSLSMAGTATAESITAGAREAQSTLVTASTDAANQVKSLAADVERSLSMAGTSTAEAITAGAREAQSTLVTRVGGCGQPGQVAGRRRPALAVDRRHLHRRGDHRRRPRSPEHAGQRVGRCAEQVKSLAADVERRCRSRNRRPAYADRTSVRRPLRRA